MTLLLSFLWRFQLQNEYFITYYYLFMKFKNLIIIIALALSYQVAQAQNPPQDAPVMTINVTHGASIVISLLAPANNTDVWVETASGTYNHLTIGVDWTAYLTFTASDTIIRIYGNVEALECKHNDLKIVGLDVSQNHYLRTLWCNENSITHLTVNPEIVGLYAMGNKLSELDVSACTNLVYLYCERNELHELDVRNSPMIEHMSFSSNHISRIDLSNKPELYGISLFGNDFDACALDTLYYDVVDRNGSFSGLIYVQNVTETNPGVFGSKTDVAFAKNWEVQDYNKGDAFNVFGDGNGCASISIDELSQNATVIISPNPINDKATITFAHGQKKPKIAVYDITGKMVMEQMAEANTTELSFAHLPKGVYILKIGTTTQKVVKQ